MDHNHEWMNMEKKVASPSIDAGNFTSCSGHQQRRHWRNFDHTHMVEIRIFVELWTWPEWISHHPFAVPPPSIESCWGSLSLSQRFIAHCKAMPIYPELFVHHSSFIIPPCVSGCLSFIMHPLSSDLVVKSLATQIPIESEARLHQLAYPYSSIFHWSSTVQPPFLVNIPED